MRRPGGEAERRRQRSCSRNVRRSAASCAVNPASSPSGMTEVWVEGEAEELVEGLREFAEIEDGIGGLGIALVREREQLAGFLGDPPALAAGFVLDVEGLAEGQPGKDPFDAGEGRGFG